MPIYCFCDIRSCLCPLPVNGKKSVPVKGVRYIKFCSSAGFGRISSSKDRVVPCVMRLKGWVDELENVSFHCVRVFFLLPDLHQNWLGF
ncbi:hypothetical protein CEXT_671111 [Caerostris extrusa]|uniref:Uncharacterized protein n=1 Tax=Caerostris extrusa TaxID=172846 RepID=A0AAV4PDR7_CAEEX|nr:hypothetical protein CEXT_671111 [Caerostris extrusa]